MLELENIPKETVNFLLEAEDALNLIGTFIMVFTTGDEATFAYEPMPRDPIPDLNWKLGGALKDRLNAAFEFNASIHDGALVFSRDNNQSIHTAACWSCRLLPKKNIGTANHAKVNKGVAWNSCLAMSNQDGVDFVVLYSQSNFTLFNRGEAHIIKDERNE